MNQPTRVLLTANLRKHDEQLWQCKTKKQVRVLGLGWRMKSFAQKLCKLWRLSFQVSMPTSPSLALQQDTNGTAASWTSAIASMARASRVKSSHCHPILCSIQASTSRRKWKRSKILTLRSMAVMFIWNIDAYCILNMYRHIWDWLRWRRLSYKGSRNCQSTWDFWKKLLRLFFACSCAGPYKPRLKVESFESTSPRVNFAAEISVL